MTSRDWSGATRYGLPGVVVGLVAAWALGGGAEPRALAQATPGAARGAAGGGQGSGTFAFTTNLSGPGASQAQLLYLVDTANQAFAVYRIDPANAGKVVKLEATRQYRYDLKLEEYNNAPPEVAAIQSMVKPSVSKP